MKILAIGDLHFKDRQGYADYISDGRASEKKGVLDFIVEQATDCDHVVLLGDNFNSKNNSSETNRAFVEFIERLNTKETYIISGNHEKKGDGKTAIDFLGELHKKNLHIFTKPGTITVDGVKMDFLPYMLNSELGVETSEGATKTMTKKLVGGDLLFTHHAITGTTFNGISTEMLREPVLPQESLQKKYRMVIAGHIHAPQRYGKVVVAGSVFTNEVGESEKFIWKIDTEGMEVEELKVPQRGIYKVVLDKEASLPKIPKDSIVKCIVTNKDVDVDKLREGLAKFDASLLIEDYPNDRKKVKIEKDAAFDFSIEALLKMYAEAKGVDSEKLLRGLQIIN